MNYGFIGCGNMGGALATALSKTTKNIILANRTASKAKDLAKQLKVKFGTNEEAVLKSDAIFLGVKPQMAEGVIASLRSSILEKRPIVISMMAGVEISAIKKMLGDEKIPVIRILPNTPVAVGEGVIVYCADKCVKKQDLNQIIKDMSCAGMMDELDESLIDAAGSLSGCGPAFMYMLMEALADGGVYCGLPRAKALAYAEMTMRGAAALALSSDKHPEQLKDEVCSPKGTTIRGVKVLEKGGFRDSAMTAVIAAYNHSKRLK